MRYILAAALLLAAPVAGQNPTPEVLKQVLERRLLSLKRDGFQERRVLFQEVKAEPRSGALYPFLVSASIWDYGAGYPANKYFGQTCLGQMNQWRFNLSRGANGEWQVDGRMTVTDSTCKDNPSAGVAAIPFESLKGDRAAGGPVPKPSGPAELHIGEWACYGTGGSLLAGLAFHLRADGSYLDGDKKPQGRWTRDAARATIAFRGGHLDGQTATKVTGTAMQLSSTVSCEPWR